MSDHSLVNNAVSQANGGNLAVLKPTISTRGITEERDTPVPSVIFEEYEPIRSDTTSITSERTFTINAHFEVSGCDYYTVKPRLYEYSPTESKWYDIVAGDGTVEGIPTGDYTGNNFTVDYEHCIIKTVPFYWDIGDRPTPLQRRRMYCIRFDLYKFGVAEPYTFAFPYRMSTNYVSLSRLLVNMNFDSTGKIIARFPSKDYEVPNGSKTKAGNLRTCEPLALLRFGINYLYIDTGDGHGFVRTRNALSHNFAQARPTFDSCFILDKCTANRISYICMLDISTGGNALTSEREIILYDNSSGEEVALLDYGYGEDGVTRNTTGNVCGYYLYCTPAVTLKEGHLYTLKIKGKRTESSELETVNNHYSTQYSQYNTNCSVTFKP